MSQNRMWARATEMAEKTPPERNRYVDLLRALSIGAVVMGHWIMAAPAYQNGVPSMDHLLQVQPWSRWLTWAFQVMPIFFFVGGFSNGVSWDSAQQRNQSYSAWLESRLRRLLGPVLPLVILWAVLGIIGNLTHVHPKMIQIGSQVSLVPVWFLAIYFVIVMLVPITRAAWQKFGMASVITPFALAIIADWVFFNTAYQWFGWFNYLFIWGAVHQLGYAWQQGKLGSVTSSVCIAVLGATALILLTQFGPYPTSLVGVPGQEMSNTTPPKLPLIALGLAQIGLLLAIEAPMRRWLSNAKVWTATVLVNGLIMPIFLWHSSVMMLLIGLGFWVLPTVFLTDPGTNQWWALRPVWVLVYFAVMMAFLPIFLWLEKISGGIGTKQNNIAVVLISALCICCGLALLAAGGVIGKGLFGLNWLAICLPIVGAFGLSMFGKNKP